MIYEIKLNKYKNIDYINSPAFEKVMNKIDIYKICWSYDTGKIRFLSSNKKIIDIFDISRGLYSKMFYSYYADEISWCETNCQSKWGYKVNEKFYFTRKSDMIAFSIRWCWI